MLVFRHSYRRRAGFALFAVARASQVIQQAGAALALRRTSPSVDVIQQAHNDAPDRTAFDLVIRVAGLRL